MRQDEPTNYLDRDALGALAEAIKDYGGGVVMISHSSEFTSALCPEKWVVADGKLAIEGQTEVQKEQAKLEWKRQEEMTDAFGNTIKVKGPKKVRRPLPAAVPLLGCRSPVDLRRSVVALLLSPREITLEKEKRVLGFREYTLNLGVGVGDGGLPITIRVCSDLLSAQPSQCWSGRNSQKRRQGFKALELYNPLKW